MDLRKVPVFAAITQRMGWLNQRQKVLAQNSQFGGPKDFAAQNHRQKLGGFRVRIPRAFGQRILKKSNSAICCGPAAP